MPFSELNISPIEQVLEAYGSGKLIIIADDIDRENEGDLAIATEKLTPKALSFMMQYGRGLICVSIARDLAKRLILTPQTENNNSIFHTPFTVSVDHRSVVGSGVSASSRCKSMLALLNEFSRPDDFVSPGHIFPLAAHPSGVLGRKGQTEGSYDLARLSGLKPSGVICEILNPDGTMSRGPELNRFAKEHKLPITTIQEIIRYRLSQEVLVSEVARSRLQTEHGEFDTIVFENEVDGKEHLALIFGELQNESSVMVRVHSECLTGDVFGSRRCDCGPQLTEAMRQIVAHGSGLVIYLRQEGRGIGLGNKLKAYALQDLGRDTVEANLELGFAPDARDFAVAAQILNALKIKSIKLLTNNPGKKSTLEDFGISVVERIPLIVGVDECNLKYIETKRTKLGHWF